MDDVYKWTEARIEAAIAFYDQSPDGQYDGMAAAALRYVLQMKRNAARFGDRW